MFQNINSVLALDMGSCMTKVFSPHAGVVFHGTSFAAKDANDEFIPVHDIDSLVSFLNPGYTVHRPVKAGEITDPDTAGAHLMNVFSGVDMFRKRGVYHAVMSIKRDMTRMQKEAFLSVARYVNIRDVVFIDTVIASAMGAGCSISGPEAHLVADIGGEKTEAALIAFSDAVSYGSVNTGGSTMDMSIADMILKKYGLVIGRHTADIIKRGDMENCAVCGKSCVTGTPVTISVPKSDILDAMSSCYNSIADVICSVIADSPPELMRDIVKNGVVLTGGAALSSGLRELIEKKTGLDVKIAAEAELAAVNGAGIAARQVFGGTDMPQRKLLA